MIDEPSTVTDDILTMIQALQADAIYGPYVVYGTPDAFGAIRDRRKARRRARRLRMRMVTVVNSKPRLYVVLR